MATKRLPHPRDPVSLAKLIGDIATGQVRDEVEDGKNEAAAAMGRKGAAARSASMTPRAARGDCKKGGARAMEQIQLGILHESVLQISFDCLNLVVADTPLGPLSAHSVP